ncbi:MAG: 50S ribosomal protein L31 [Candidatus Chisholmbacteria bacterium]|nr:50S ribosomal protein L31 [Candidatus Chisholmbacteria bacterium]
MKATLHPTYYHDAVVTCSCGNSFTTGSTKKDIHVELCSACHPFFTGEMKYVDTMGRVEKFQARQAQAAQIKASRKAKKVLKKRETRPETLREMMLREQRKLEKSDQPPKN